ncbi:MAG TPA: GNAT family N-acetyltransferase [Polyangiaceae bacterium]|jgi:GNAT superfamily N-acetyltransferase
MGDMLVRLYDLPPLAPVLEELRQKGVAVRRPISPEKRVVVDWVQEIFGNRWAGETEVSFAYHPPHAFIATREGAIIGFSCHDSCKKNVFGPTGVGPSARGLGVGTALLLASLHDMERDGYSYAVIGSAGPTDFYAKVVGAIPIPDSSNGIYRGMIDDPDDWRARPGFR